MARQSTCTNHAQSRQRQWLDDDLLAKVTASLLQQSGVQPVIPNTPGGVEVCLRSGENKSVLILINHNKTDAHVDLPHAMNNLLDNKSHTSVDLLGYGVAVLERQ
jgi:beta-galactosidase GanA